MKQKLTSRKFWAAVIGVITGIAMTFGLDDGIMSTAAGAATSLLSIVTYIVTEGKIDKEKIAEAAEKLKDTAEKIE